MEFGIRLNLPCSQPGSHCEGYKFNVYRDCEHRRNVGWLDNQCTNKSVIRDYLKSLLDYREEDNGIS